MTILRQTRVETFFWPTQSPDFQSKANPEGESPGLLAEVRPHPRVPSPLVQDPGTKGSRRGPEPERGSSGQRTLELQPGVLSALCPPLIRGHPLNASHKGQC